MKVVFDLDQLKRVVNGWAMTGAMANYPHHEKTYYEFSAAVKEAEAEAPQYASALKLIQALSKAPQEGEKMTWERMQAIVEVGHDREVILAKLVADQKYQVDLLAAALGNILVAAKVVTEVPLTGPQLLQAAKDYQEHLES